MEDNISNGWISLYKKFTHWKWYKDKNVKTLFIHLLLKASYEDTEWDGIKVKRGQVVTSREHLADETGLSEQEVRTSLKKLKSTSEITSKSTNKYTVITIEKYDFYQIANTIPTNKLTSKLTTSNNINKIKLNILFNYLIYKEKNFENLKDIDRQAIVIILKRLEIYTEKTDYLTEDIISQLQLQYWTITEIYLSPYKVYLNELTRNTFLLKYLQTEKYIKIDSEDKINDFVSYFITCLRKGFEKKDGSKTIGVTN